MKIAAAQIKSVIGKINENLEVHYQMINWAISKKVNLITFPEMSLTGYCREEAHKLAFSKNDPRLNTLIDLSAQGGIIIIVGAPIKLSKQLYIGSFIIKPNKSIDIYTKQYLHTGEELYFKSSFDFNPSIQLGDEKIALAICADIDHPEHPKAAKGINSTLYLPSIFFSKEGIYEGHRMLKKYAADYSINILMSNYCNLHWNINAGGKSGFWNTNGLLLSQLEKDKMGLVIIEKRKNQWQANSFYYDEVNTCLKT